MNSEAFSFSPLDLRARLRSITLLAVGLVLLTASAVAHLVVGLPWGAAFVLGAILAPTDPVADPPPLKLATSRATKSEATNCTPPSTAAQPYQRTMGPEDTMVTSFSGSARSQDPRCTIPSLLRFGRGGTIP
ncbi:MAG: cation:proton antiporter [Actinomycetota bacterium]|nr:cation:proton antiporter [Actinomycetota bacterium]